MFLKFDWYVAGPSTRRSPDSVEGCWNFPGSHDFELPTANVTSLTPKRAKSFRYCDASSASNSSGPTTAAAAGSNDPTSAASAPEVTAMAGPNLRIRGVSGR
ncbi:hypothetical protein CCHR01_13361 [Colletotrichum chrysophilum]|uniref:Uncharacterized protein n=1 Tax=Colletotrichum chrysophilum TaxID=1836956 RepID=A0AAD9EAJ5_9PEZI|nr:hypothetical protein CCHR01_13361 [Colletotrichum chrysophilum]